MIRTVAIPTKVSRMGCAPGAGCCDDCGSHGSLQGTHTNRIATPGEGVRNSSMRAHMGDTVCDQDGNCYTDGVLTAAPLTTGPGCPPGVPNCGTSAGVVSNTTTYILAGVAIVAVLEFMSRRR